MPRFHASVEKDEVVIVATIHLRPVLVKSTRRKSDYIVVNTVRAKARVGGQQVQVAESIKIVKATNDAVAARTAARESGGTILARQGQSYRVVPS